MEAITYARWSSQEQTKGSTLQRQTELTERFCKSRGWSVVERLSDSGLSAYSGANLKTGELGKLTSRLEDEGGDGKVIVVEKLDRLSRQPPLIMTNWIQRVAATGASIATADGRHLIDQASLSANPMGVMAIIFEAFVGYDESKKKSDRGTENWRIKRESGKPLTAQCPAWLTLSEDRSQYVLIEDRAAIVRRIFADQDRGLGKHMIARQLNAEGVEPWGRGKRQGQKWHASYIAKIVTNVAVLGDHHHGTKPRAAAKRTIVGDIVKGYYPAVIDEALFRRVNDRKRQAAIATSKRGTIVNLFSGIARCSCGAFMAFRAKGTAKRASGAMVREDYLTCDRAFRPSSRGGCDHKTNYNYTRFRDAVLDHLLHKALDDQFFRAPDSISEFEVEVARLARETEDRERRMKLAWRVYEDDGDANLLARYKELRREHQAVSARLEEAEARLEDARGSVSPQEHLARVGEVRAMLDCDDVEAREEARRRVRIALADIIEKCVFDAGKQFAAVHIIGGAGVLFVGRDGSAQWFDLAKKGRDYSYMDADGQAAIAAYLRRSEAA